MKKWMKGLAVGCLALALAACGAETQEPADTKPGTDVENQSELTLEEVFKKAQEVSENTKSMHADMTMKQKISMPEMGEMETEIYMSEAGMFMKNPEGEEWMKLPVDNFEEMMESMNSGVDANVDFETLGEFIEDFTFEQDDNQYILKLKASGEEFQKIIEEQLDAAGLTEGMAEEELDVLNDMTIHDLAYEIFIDKETFQTTAFNLVIDIELNVEGEATVRMNQDLKAKMSQINDISEINIPQEILDNAVEY